MTDPHRSEGRLMADPLDDDDDFERCRVCGCTEWQACVIDGEPCAWADAGRTLCTNPACIQHAQESARVAKSLGAR